MRSRRSATTNAMVGLALAHIALLCGSRNAWAGIASNEYTLFADVPAGEDTVVSPGESVTVNVSLTALSGSPTHNAAIFRAAFSRSGFVLTGYTWSSPYVTGSIFDDSRPPLSSLPALVTPELISGFGYPDDVADVEFSNVVPSGSFASGLLLSFQFLVPEDAPAGQFLVSVVPDTFSAGFDEVTTYEGPRLLFIVIPTPAAPAVLIAGGFALSRRRRTLA